MKPIKGKATIHGMGKDGKPIKIGGTVKFKANPSPPSFEENYSNEGETVFSAINFTPTTPAENTKEHDRLIAEGYKLDLLTGTYTKTNHKEGK